MLRSTNEKAGMMVLSARVSDFVHDAFAQWIVYQTDLAGRKITNILLTVRYLKMELQKRGFEGKSKERTQFVARLILSDTIGHMRRESSSTFILCPLEKVHLPSPSVPISKDRAPAGLRDCRLPGHHNTCSHRNCNRGKPEQRRKT